jgi:hypothetical protein
MSMLLPALIAAVVSGIALRLLSRSGGLPFDRANVRSLHLALFRVAGWPSGSAARRRCLPGNRGSFAAAIVCFFFSRLSRHPRCCGCSYNWRRHRGSQLDAR